MKVNKTSFSNRLLLNSLACLGLLFLLWLRLHQPPNTVDDAYITFRYARNIAQGVGFVYNPGEHVLGTTTPAYALLLALLSRLSDFYDYPHLALMVNALLDALTFCLLLRLAYRLIGWPWVGLAAATLFALDGRTLDFSTGGMETSFNVMAILLTLVFFFENRRMLAALAAGLVVLIRPDGVTLAAVLFSAWGLAALRRKAPWPWKEMVLFSAVVAPWIIFAFLYFGNPIPQSILAKSVLYRVPKLMAFRAFLVQLRTVFPFSLPALHDPEPLERQLLQAVLPVALCVLGLITLLKRHAQAWVLGVYLLLFISFFSLGNPLWLGWYEVPLMPLYWILILAAVIGLARWLASLSALPRKKVDAEVSRRPQEQRERGRLRHPPIDSRGSQVVLSLCAFALLAVPHLSRLNAIPWEKLQRPVFVLNPAFNKRREEDYELLARMLLPSAQHDRLVAIPEIGAFGYVYPGRLFDTSGLISPPVLKYFPIPDTIPVEIYSVPRQMIFDLRPDLFVSFDSFMQVTLPPDDPEFLRLYRPTIGLTSHAAFGIQRLMTYRRADLPVEVTLPPEAQPANVDFGPDLLRLEGYTLTSWADQENRYLEVTLFWRNGNAALKRDLLVRVNLLAETDQQVYQILDQPGEELFPSQSWTPGMVLVDRYQLKRPVPDVGPYTITVTLFDSAQDGALPARTEAGAALIDNTLVIPLNSVELQAAWSGEQPSS